MKLTKILSVLFVLILTFSLCAVSVFADEAEETGAADALTEAESAKDADETVPAEETETADDADDGEKAEGRRLTFLESLGYMGVGMLCIIIVMSVLIGVTVLLNKVTAPKQK